MARRTLVRRISWRKAVVMLAIGAAIIAAIAASYVFFGFLYTITLFIILSVFYVVVFHGSWCVVALKTLPRDTQ